MAPFSYSWNFGDATSKSTEEKPTHIYPNFGLYTVTVTVKDVNEQTAEQSVSINVSNTTNYTQSDMDAQYQSGRQACINDPASCGIIVSSQECFPSNIMGDLTIYIPQLNYVSSIGTMSLWANFEFVGEHNGDYLWRLHEFGQK